MYRPEHIAGLDEAGRGPLAGPVYAAAVVLSPFHPIPGLKDSKQLTEPQRQRLDEQIRAEAPAYAIAKAEPAEIDALNIHQATLLAMRRALEALAIQVDFALVDGKHLPPSLPCPAEWLVKGDAKSDPIRAASILAKVARDAEMTRLHAQYPAYGLAKHKGYPTSQHLQALREKGPSPIHRLSFAPCKNAR